LLLHNNLWSITRDLFGWWLIPPVDVDPLKVPRPMPTKSLAFQDLERHRDSRREKQDDRMDHIRELGFDVVARSWLQLSG